MSIKTHIYLNLICILYKILLFQGECGTAHTTCAVNMLTFAAH